MENLSTICSNFSEQTLRLEDFITQNQAKINNLNDQFKKYQQDLLQFKNNIEKTFQEIETNISTNQNFLSKLVSGANTKLVQEQINQRQIELINQMQKINDTVSYISQEIDKVGKEFIKSSQQIMTDYKSTEKQLQLVLKANQRANTISPNYANAQLQQSIQQAIEALNTARQGIQQQKIFSEISKSLDNLLQ